MAFAHADDDAIVVEWKSSCWLEYGGRDWHAVRHRPSNALHSCPDAVVKNADDYLMSIARISIFVLVASLASAARAESQVPDDLRAAMRARDMAFYAADAVQWEKYTAPAHTTVQQDGSFLTRAERLVTLRAQAPRPYIPRSREQNERRGDVVIARFFSGGLWVLEVWTHETGSWMVLMTQVTTAKR